MHKRFWWWIASLGLLSLVSFFAWSNRYNIYDWVTLRNYTPPAEIIKLASASGMSEYGKRLFYVNKPELSDKQQFATQCSNKEQTIVMGCYNGTNIYVYDVTEPTLEGVEEVTAAHEMLHAAYDRLSSSEKQKVDTMVEQAFKRVNNPRISQLAETYRKQDPSVVPNELHSILGSEVRNLGSELEAYYAKYFVNRLKVVSLSEQYEKVFEDLNNQADKYEAELTLRNNEITERKKSAENKYISITNQKNYMDKLVSQSKISEYNRQVPDYNNNIAQYNSEVENINRLIAEYNEILEKLKSLAIQQETLAKSIDSRLNTINQ